MRYAVHAPAKGMCAALTPGLTRTYAGWSSRGKIYGQPGTLAVPAPDPAATPQNEKSALAAVGTFNSSNAPNRIYPPIYYEAGDGYGQHEHAPVARISDNQMPVPATRAPNVLVFDPYRARKGGQRQVYQPQVVQTFRGMKGTPYG